MQVIYRLVAQRGTRGIVLTVQPPSSEPKGALTPVRFTRADGIEVWADIIWQIDTPPTLAERADVLARIRRIADRNDRLPSGPDWEGETVVADEGEPGHTG